MNGVKKNCPLAIYIFMLYFSLAFVFSQEISDPSLNITPSTPKAAGFQKYG